MNTKLKKQLKNVFCALMVLTAVLISVMPVYAQTMKTPVSITVEQIFAASSATDEATFAYRLTPYDPGNPMPAGSTDEGYIFTITGNDNKNIGPLEYGRQGIFRYELGKVISRDKPGYTHDARRYTIEVYVDNSLNTAIVVLNEDGTKADAVTFAARYDVMATDPEMMADPPVRKTVSGNPGNDSRFTFKLVARKSSYPMPEGSLGGTKTLSITGSGEAEFGTWSYNEAGTYYYTVYEVNGREKGYTYDDAVYTITDTVTDENSRLVLSRTVTDSKNRQVKAMDFVNIYSPGGPGGPGGGNGNDLKSGASSTPKTSDAMNIQLYLTILAFSGTFMTGLIVVSRRREDQTKRKGADTK